MAIFVDESVVRGAEDYRAGVMLDACPFAERQKRVAWERGWLMQRKLWKGAQCIVGRKIARTTPRGFGAKG